MSRNLFQLCVCLWCVWYVSIKSQLKHVFLTVGLSQKFGKHWLGIIKHLVWNSTKLLLRLCTPLLSADVTS